MRRSVLGPMPLTSVSWSTVRNGPCCRTMLDNPACECFADTWQQGELRPIRRVHVKLEVHLQWRCTVELDTLLTNGGLPTPVQ